MFKIILEQMLQELAKKKKNKTLTPFIQDRLNCSLELYIESVNSTCDYLLSRSNLKVLKAMAAQYNQEKINSEEILND